MRVDRHLVDRQRHGFGAADLSDDVTLTLPDGHTALQIGQRERRLAVAAILRTEERE